MATFDVGKNFDEVEKPKPLEARVYAFRLTEPARMERNKKDTGFNLILEYEVFDEPDPMNNGRPFMDWISMPSAETDDFERKTRRGGTVADFKMGQIEKTVRALSGEVSGSNFDIPDGATFKRAVIVSAIRIFFISSYP